MKLTKFVAWACCVLVSTTLFAQEQTVKSQRKSETTVEDEYMASAEDTIIGELASSDDYDNKLVALSYLKDAVEGGRTSPEHPP